LLESRPVRRLVWSRAFQVRLENRSDENSQNHCPGLTPPWQQDGVPSLSQETLEPGEWLGPYEIVRELGRGGIEEFVNKKLIRTAQA
jgi:hypothetical protein